MQGYKTKNAFLIQFLVQNYLEYKNSDKNVYIYGELINDIDVFIKRLEDDELIRKKFKSSNPANIYPQLDAFIDLISPESYIYSYEVKYASKEYMYNFDHIYQLISRMKYPPNTKIELILVSPETYEIFDDSLKTNIEIFYKLKSDFFKLPDNLQYNIINYFHNNKSNLKSQNTSIIDALSKSINAAKKDTIKKYTGDKELPMEEFIAIRDNLDKVTIQLLSIKELLSIPLSSEVMKKELGLF